MAVFMGSTFKGRGRDGKGQREKRDGRGKGSEREVEFSPLFNPTLTTEY